MSETLPPLGPDDPFGPGGDSGSGTSTSVLERVETTEQVEPGDHERFSHYVRKEKILSSALEGTPVVALCGKVWVPGRDPKKFPVCPICQEIYDGLRDPQDGDKGGSGDGGGKGGGASGGGGGRSWFGRGSRNRS